MSISPINGQSTSEKTRPEQTQTAQLEKLKTHYALEGITPADQQILAATKVMRERRRGVEGKQTLIVFPSIANMSPRLFSQINALRKQPLLRVVLPDDFLTTSKMQASATATNPAATDALRSAQPSNRHRQRQDRTIRIAAIATLILGLGSAAFTLQIDA